jgi:hypothetical protein
LDFNTFRPIADNIEEGSELFHLHNGELAGGEYMETTTLTCSMAQEGIKAYVFNGILFSRQSKARVRSIGRKGDRVHGT